MEKGTVILAAGGTGGHVFPAEALGKELIHQGLDIHCLTDSRGRRFVHFCPNDKIHIINSATFSGKNPITFISAFFNLMHGVYQSYRIFQRYKPCLVVGFGGYPTFPPLYMAVHLGIPTLIHEQNAIMGRTNQFLASRVNIIAGGFLEPEGRFFDKIVLTGNPLRSSILQAMRCPYRESKKKDDFFLLIFGGSQGTSFFSRIIPKVINQLDKNHIRRLVIIQQALADEIENLCHIYKKLNVRADVRIFFHNMAEYIAKAHYIIARAGASTVSEIAAIGRPALLVPYPYALDHDQMKNATALARSGGVKVMLQSELTPNRLAVILKSVLDDSNMLKVMAEKVRMIGTPHATQKLANVALMLIKERKKCMDR